MVSEYDVFYVVAKNGAVAAKDIVRELGKEKKEYQNIFNNILILERKGLVKREGDVKIVNSKESQGLFNIISFCLRNNMNYNILLKGKMVKFLERASKKEFFTINDIKMHAATFKFYTDALSKYGLLIIISRKPLRCKLLRNSFILELINHFKRKPQFYVSKQKSLIPLIGKELKIYRHNLKINSVLINNIEKKRQVNFVYSSLSLEGNPLTLPQTQKLILENVMPGQNLESIEETVNYKKAIEEMMENSVRKVKLTLDMILKYHNIAMNSKHFAGRLRTQDVVIKKNPNFKTSNWRDVPAKISKLLEIYSDFESMKRNVAETVMFAAFFHNEFQRIHPFLDGNSRISRLLMLHILRMHGLPVMELPLGYFDSYLDLTKRSRKRDDAALSNLVQEIVLTNLKNINNALKI
jgi:Fic family protein